MHLLVWAIYSLAALMVMACVWWVSLRLAGASLKWLIRLVLFALLFTPVQLGQEPLWWAPVIAAVALELLGGDMDAALGYLPLLMVTLTAVVAGVTLVSLLIRKRCSNRIQRQGS